MSTNHEATPRAVLLEEINPAAMAQFETAGYEVATFPKKISNNELVELAEGAQVLGIRSGPKIKEVVGEMKDIQAVGCYCVGTDQVVGKATNERGIAVFNSPFDNGRSVAELVIGSTFSLYRRMQEHNQSLHDGVWSKTEENSFEVKGKTMGIIGYGNIGQQVGILAESIGMNVVYFDIQDRPSLGSSKALGLDKLLEEADVVTVHVPGGRNGPVIGSDELARMKPSSYLINAARAQAIDYESLDLALQDGKLAGAALDVFPIEPGKKGDVFESAFRGNPRVLLTPHIGGSTQEAQKDAALSVTKKLLTYVDTGSAVGSVNLPGSDLGPQSASVRMTYVHQNKPGAEAEIVKLFGEHDINIAADILRTKGELGYGIYDIEIPNGVAELVAGVRGLTNHIRVRAITGA